MTIEIGMPVYRPSGRLEAVLTALALQTYKNFYISIYNDTKPEETEELRKDAEIVQRMRETYGLNITLVQNPHNLGYMKNMHQIFDKATGDILFLLADDDIVSRDCIQLMKESFDDPEVGCVSRPYYWFLDDFRKAVRFEGSCAGDSKPRKVDFMRSPIEDVGKCMSATGQLSGLAFRRSFLAGMPFVEDMFTVHIYPFLYIFKDHPCAYMPYPTIAVAGSTSQCQNDIYTPSPLEQWVSLYRNMDSSPAYQARQKEVVDRFVTNDFVGLAQIKNYGTCKELMREICNFVRFRKKNLLSPRFYFFALGSVLCPRPLLKKLVAFYKNKVLARTLRDADIHYEHFPFDEVAPYWIFPQQNERSH
ncbi:MAG TPA: hypothetical protein DDW78_03210 [Treponema sp.]|nr:hypothetical protein [Treponema sp.]